MNFTHYGEHIINLEKVTYMKFQDGYGRKDKTATLTIHFENGESLVLKEKRDAETLECNDGCTQLEITWNYWCKNIISC